MSVSGWVGDVATRLQGRVQARTRRMTRADTNRLVISTALALSVPFGIAVAWVPIRSRLPNVDLALVLVVAVAGIGTLGRRAGVVLGAVSAALWFEFFDTAPFERLGIARNPDIETTLILAIVAVVVGELAVRVTRHRGYEQGELEKLSSMRSAAELVASGEELVAVIGAVAADLIRLLDLTGCTFESTESDPRRPAFSRGGDLVRSSQLLALPPTSEALRAELPVIVLGEPMGHFVLEFDAKHPPKQDRILVAMTLADNVGAAFLAQAPPPLPPDKQPIVRLKVVRRDSGSAPVGSDARPASAGASAGRPHETSGLSCTAEAASNS